MPEGKKGSRFETGKRLHQLLSKPTPYMERLISGFRRLLRNDENQLKIPVQWLPNEYLNGMPTDAELGDREDPVLTLFIRINTAGIAPNGEELAFSILKSVMPECREGIENLSREFMPPPRMVLLLSTFVLAQSSDRTDDSSPPAFPDVTRFRRLVQGADPAMPEFRKALKAMLEDGTAKTIIDQAHRLLVIDSNRPDERPFRLLPLQAARIAQRNEHAFLLLLIWISSRTEEKLEWCGLDEAEHRRLVGLMCVLTWFHASDTNTATNRRKSLTLLWTSRKKLHVPGILAALIEPAGSEIGPILPLPPPKIIAAAIEHCVTGWGFGGYETQLWKDTDAWNRLKYRLGDIGEANRWYERFIKQQKNGDEPETAARATERRETAWNGLIDRTIENIELVLYGQRQAISKWYQEFDPTSPAQLQDTEQPWDLDHIHPQSYVQSRGNIPPIIRAWHSTIGNLRAWPAEINRSQHDLDPERKISQPAPQEIANYGMRTATDLRNASAIKNPDDWCQSHPGSEAGAPGHYLRNYTPDTHKKWHSNRQALMKAITGRYLSLYKTFYVELCIRDLFLRASE